MISLTNENKQVFIEISRDLENKWIYANWIGQVSADDVKNGALKVLEEIEATNFKKLLNNNKKLLGHWQGANQWIGEVWIPKAVNLGFESFAHVLADYSYGQLSAEQMSLSVGDSFEMKLFKSVDEAKEWLRTR